MTRTKEAALVGATVLFLLFLAYFAPPAQAQQCQYLYDQVVGVYLQSGVPVGFLTPEALAKYAAQFGQEGATRGFIVSGNGLVLLGLEVDGCLLPPIDLTPQPDTLTEGTPA